MNRFYLFLVSPPFGKLPDGGFDVAAQLLRQTVHLYFFRFFGGVRQILFSTNFGGIDRRLRAAQSYPHFLVEP